MWGAVRKQSEWTLQPQICAEESGCLRIYGALTDLTSGASEMLLVMIRLGVTEQKETGFLCLLEFIFVFCCFFGGSGAKYPC